MKDAEIALALRDGLYAAADVLLMESTNPWELDAAMAEFGCSIGVCAAQDAEGLDAVLMRRRQLDCAQTPPPSPILLRMVAEGRLGRKVSVGWYRYPGGGGLVIDPLVEDLLREEARFAGTSRQELSNATLMDRLIFGCVGVTLGLLPALGRDAMRRMDQVSCDRLGFPESEGGVLTYARAKGQDHMGEALSPMTPAVSAQIALLFR